MEEFSLQKKIADLEQRVSVLEGKFSVPAGSISRGVAKKISPKEFLLEKKPRGAVQVTLVLGYYIENYIGNSPFNLDDLNKVYKVAKEVLPANLNDKINKNIDKGYVVESEEKKEAKKAWHLTGSGENFINQLNSKNG